MTRYVVGFLFNDYDEVALIKKERPNWQKDKWNGIGGHIEEGEDPVDAMMREFKEETNVEIPAWHEFICVRGNEYELYCFSARTEKVELVQTTDERPAWISIHELDRYPMLDNLAWLIPMANYKFKLRGEIFHDNPEC